MFGAVVSTVTGLFDQRFLRNAFFLAFAFVVLSLGIVAAGLGRLGDWLATVTAWDVAAQLLATAGLVGVVWFLAAVLESQTRAITRVYEGYWGGPLRPLRKAREDEHKRRLRKLRDERYMERVYLAYPLSTEQVMPTRLGNILRASEEYPRLRYGLNGLIVWPRMYPLLPEEVVMMVAQSRGALEFLLVLSALSAIFGMLSGIFLLAVAGPVGLYIACVAGAAIVAAAAYRSSLAAAELYAEVVRSAFDEYRQEVLTAMHLQLPDNPAAERAQWGVIEELILQNRKPSAPYSHPQPAEPDA